jgi:hypothetical protein
MRIITERISVTPPADLPFTATTLARLTVHYPMYKGLMDLLNTALSAQTTQTATVKPLRHSAKLWVSHGFQSIINATVRGVLPSSVLGYYGLAVGARRVPSMGSEQAILSAGVMLSTGEQARVAAGGRAHQFSIVGRNRWSCRCVSASQFAASPIENSI